MVFSNYKQEIVVDSQPQCTTTALIACKSIHFDDDASIYHDIRYIDTSQMCIDTVSLPNVSRYDDILIYRCISSAAHVLPKDLEQLSAYIYTQLANHDHA